MRARSPQRFCVLVLALSMLAGCSGNHSGGSGSTGASPAPTDPVDFPMFDGATVLSSRHFHTTISKRPGVGDSAVFTEGAGTYDGNDVVAGTQALMPSLEAWLADLNTHPPSGYENAVTGNTVDAVRSHTRDLGIDFQVFQRIEDGKRHGVAVLAVDPQILDAKVGPMLALVGKYPLLPKTFRDSIDQQARRQTGFTISDATDPNSPIGAAVTALSQLRDFGGRGIIIIDAAKQ
jgi:hypothetical protein